MARDMYGPMTGASAWMMRSTWDTPHLLLLWLMWAVMMAAMMLPSAVPLLLLCDGVPRRRRASGRVAVHVSPMGAGYLLVWAMFSIGATVLQRVRLGCCWALMLLLFAGGVMNLAVIVGLTAIVLIEKVTPI